jgi:Glyoxalase-like domain
VPLSRLDHIVITAPSLGLGVDYLRQTLGVTPQMGGEHPRMGTHNCFVKLGAKVYLEVIAVNPNAPRPQRPRWFALDELGANELPRLATWVARTDDIEAAAAASPLPLGKVEPMTRGQLR